MKLLLIEDEKELGTKYSKIPNRQRLCLRMGLQ